MAETDIHRQYDSGKNGSSFDENVREPVEIVPAAANDAGVHALGQVANFHTESDMSTGRLWPKNRYLPEDIAVVEVSRRHRDFIAG